MKMNLGMGLTEDNGDLLRYSPALVSSRTIKLAKMYFGKCPWAFRTIVSASLAGLEDKVERMAKAGIPYEAIVYDPEYKNTPEEETGDLLGAVDAAAEIAGRNGKKLMMIPGMGLMEDNKKLYGQLAAIADLWCIQSQALQNQNEAGAAYHNAVMPYVTLLREGNRKLPIWLQISVTPGRKVLTARKWYAYARSVPFMAGYFCYDAEDPKKPKVLTDVLATVLATVLAGEAT
jgi:hypothetical protein